MATIDKLDVSVYIQYAKRTQMIEQINRQYHLGDAKVIPPQTELVDLYPKLSEMDLLMGIVPKHTPWALFFPPKRFRSRRRSPFKFGRVFSAIGDDDEREEDERKLFEQECETEEEEGEKKTLLSCLKQVGQIKGWMDFIVGRVGQFLQG